MGNAYEAILLYCKENSTEFQMLKGYFYCLEYGLHAVCLSL